MMMRQFARFLAAAACGALLLPAIAEAQGKKSAPALKPVDKTLVGIPLDGLGREYLMSISVIPQVQAATSSGLAGRIVTGWHANIGHWLEWTVTPAQAGAYHLVFRYATDSPDTRRELLLNGNSPGVACKSIRFPRTGGFATRSDDWQYLILGGERPVALQLSPGENRIRMVNLNDGLAVDQLLLVPAE